MDISTVKNYVKAVRVAHDAQIAQNYVSIQSGKGLSTNDFSTAEKNKLASISSGAQVNVIEGINFNGSNVSIEDKVARFSLSSGISNIQLDGVNCSIDNDTAFLNLDSYAKKSDVASVLKYKGGVNSAADLPDASLNSVGDVWNISVGGGNDKDNHSILSGDNVAWTEQGWDVLAGSFDFSNFVTIQSGKSLSTNDFSTEYKNKLDSIEAGAQVNKIENFSIVGGSVEIDSSTKVANITVSGGAASLGSVLSGINSLASVGSGNIIYTSDDNTFSTAPVTSFARNLLSCNSAAELRNFWSGVRDIDFDEAGNLWSAYGSPFVSRNNAAFNKALQLNGASYILSISTFELGGDISFAFDGFLAPSESDSFQVPAGLYFFNSNSQLDQYVTLCIQDGNCYLLYAYDFASSQSTVKSSYIPCPSSFHFRVAFLNDSLTLFINNVSSSVAVNLPKLNFFCNLGSWLYNDFAPSLFFSGSLSEFRLFKANSFDDSIPSTPYSLDSDTLALLHFNV